MSETHLMNIDLNLLVALDVLFEERHITRSASRLNITQSAMSRRLNRLRQTFDDLLMVKGKPAPRARVYRTNTNVHDHRTNINVHDHRTVRTN